VAVIARQRDGVDRDDEAGEVVVRRGHHHDRRTVVEGGAAAGAHQEEEHGGQQGAQDERCAKSRATADNWHAIKPFAGNSGPRPLPRHWQLRGVARAYVRAVTVGYTCKASPPRQSTFTVGPVALPLLRSIGVVNDWRCSVPAGSFEFQTRVDT